VAELSEQASDAMAQALARGASASSIGRVAMRDGPAATVRGRAIAAAQSADVERRVRTYAAQLAQAAGLDPEAAGGRMMRVVHDIAVDDEQPAAARVTAADRFLRLIGAGPDEHFDINVDARTVSLDADTLAAAVAEMRAARGGAAEVVPYIGEERGGRRTCPRCGERPVRPKQKECSVCHASDMRARRRKKAQ